MELFQGFAVGSCSTALRIRQMERNHICCVSVLGRRSHPRGKQPPNTRQFAKTQPNETSPARGPTNCFYVVIARFCTIIQCAKRRPQTSPLALAGNFATLIFVLRFAFAAILSRKKPHNHLHAWVEPDQSLTWKKNLLFLFFYFFFGG
eukprot:c14001_g1_i1.p1 GENE.c14001_g1_i1~~c14001_g1_i1.p1  ORF type:complete len:148 (+),score=11.57 c14001_g1_i1:68-511(+)